MENPSTPHPLDREFGFEQKFTRESKIRQMEKFILLFQSPQYSMPALNKLILCAEFFPRYNNSEFHVTLGKFLGLVASQLEYLKVEMIENNDLIFEEDSYSKIGRFEHLKTLETRVPRVCYCYDTLSCLTPCSLHFPKRGSFLFLPHLIQTILKRTVVLQTLSILWSSSFRLRWHNLESNILRSIPKSVQRLEMSLRFSVSDYEVFGSLHLPNLTSLSLTVFCDFDVQGNAIYYLFANSKNETLVELDLTIENTHFVRCIAGFKLPIFPNLSTFKLRAFTGSSTTKPEIPFPTLFPKVTEFSLKSCLTAYPFRDFSPDWPLQIPTPQWTAPLVKSCTLCLDDPGSHPQLASGLSCRFPGLTKLVIHLRDRFFEEHHLSGIFSDQIGLEHLKLELESDHFSLQPIPSIDSTLTGIPAQTLENIRENPEWTGILISTIKTEPGISDLKNLKTLSIKSQIPTNITDVTAYLGFLLIVPLEKLVIEEFNMSQRCITHLKLKFGDGVIDRHRSC